MTVTLICVGSLKERYLSEAVAEYKKRISQYAKFEEIELKEEKIADENDRGAVERALSAEGEKILASVPSGAYTVALCVEGKELDSPALARLVGEAEDTSGKIAFIIGSSHGLSSKVKGAVNFRLSFSRLTFPHQLMRVNFCEAIYRSFTILRNKKYHK